LRAWLVLRRITNSVLFVSQQQKGGEGRSVIREEALGRANALRTTKKISTTRFSGNEELRPANFTAGSGTLLWMAPELLKGAKDYGPPIDVYSCVADAAVLLLLFPAIFLKKNPSCGDRYFLK
jgi:serine/threonine protein kinase